MFRLSVDKRFRASHSLQLPGGKKEELHNHNWLVRAQVSSRELDSYGLVMDFCRLEEMLKNIIQEFDNTSLEQSEYFARNNPTAENVAQYVYEQLERKLPENVHLDNITVTEHSGCRAVFEK